MASTTPVQRRFPFKPFHVPEHCLPGQRPAVPKEELLATAIQKLSERTDYKVGIFFKWRLFRTAAKGYSTQKDARRGQITSDDPMISKQD